MESSNGFQVMSDQCATCIFTSRTPITAERFLELRQAWKEHNQVQECHVATVAGEHVACRGHFNRWLAGTMPYPLEEIKQELGLNSMSREDFVQLSARMGWITFVDMSKE